jgi:hypothetical protein
MLILSVLSNSDVLRGESIPRGIPSNVDLRTGLHRWSVYLRTGIRPHCGKNLRQCKPRGKKTKFDKSNELSIFQILLLISN